MTHETPRSYNPRTVALFVGLAGLLALAIALVATHGSGTSHRRNAGSGRSHLAAAVTGEAIGTAPIQINSQGTMFDPSSSTAARPANSMSASQAYSVFEGPGVTMASGTSYAYGTLTWPLADGNYVYKNRPVWAYRFAGCMGGSEPTVVNGATPSAAPDSTSCTSWIFLDALTGENLLTTQQQ